MDRGLRKLAVRRKDGLAWEKNLASGEEFPNILRYSAPPKLFLNHGQSLGDTWMTEKTRGVAKKYLGYQVL